jgi:hypothetical protein
MPDSRMLRSYRQFLAIIRCGSEVSRIESFDAPELDVVSVLRVVRMRVVAKARKGVPSARDRDRLIGRLRRICMALPETNEKLSHGEPTWFAGKGKVFAMLDDHHHGAAHLAVWLPQPFGAQEALIGSDPERFFRPPYVGVSGWVGMVLDTRPDWDVIAALVRDAYLTVATAKLRRLVSPAAESATAARSGKRVSRPRRT